MTLIETHKSKTSLAVSHARKNVSGVIVARRRFPTSFRFALAAIGILLLLAAA